MLLKIFKGTGPGVILLIMLTLGALWTGAFLEPRAQSLALYEVKPMPFYGLLKDLIGGHQVAGLILSMVFISVMLFLLVNFNTSVFFINERTFLPASLYLLITSIFTELQNLNPVLPASICLMLALFRIMDSYRKAGNISNFFDAGILTGIGSLFYCNMLWFCILPVMGIVLLRTVSIREIVLSLLGLATPYILLFGVYYALDYDLGRLLSEISDNLFGPMAGYRYTTLTIVVVVYFGLLLIISIGFLLNQINSKKIKSRKTFNLLLSLLLISLGLYLLPGSGSVEIVWIAGIPASYLLTNYFIFSRKKVISGIVFSVSFLLVLLLQVLHIF